jgi:hypothetical protein
LDGGFGDGFVGGIAEGEEDLLRTFGIVLRKAGDGFLVTLFANFIFGVFASIAWGFAGCSALAYVSQKLR